MPSGCDVVGCQRLGGRALFPRDVPGVFGWNVGRTFLGSETIRPVQCGERRHPEFPRFWHQLRFEKCLASQQGRTQSEEN